MTILALDLGTHTGVARGDAGGRPTSETWHMPGGGCEDVGPFMNAFMVNLKAALDGVTLLVFEAPYVNRGAVNPNVVRRLYGMPAVVEGLASARGVPVFECNIMTVKKSFAGHGRADKGDMIFSARRRGFDPKDEHQADALACWHYTVACRFQHFAALYDPIYAAARHSEQAGA